jgi:hypothetical protein
MKLHTKLYLFAEKIGYTTLCNYIIDKLSQQIQKLSHLQQLLYWKFVYSKTKVGSQLRIPDFVSEARLKLESFVNLRTTNPNEVKDVFNDEPDLMFDYLNLLEK